MPRISCKKCRRLGESLCGREKCAFKTRPYPPGMRDSERKHKSVPSEYSYQLKEKQKIRTIYGISERQLSNYVKNLKYLAAKYNISESEALIMQLERRLDNIVYRMGLASTRALARQLVSHGHILLNSRKNTIPSTQVSKNFVVSVRENSKTIKVFTNNIENFKNHKAPNWLELDVNKMSAKVVNDPKESDYILDIKKVLEYYSR